MFLRDFSTIVWKKKVKKISRLELGEQLRHSSSKVARYSKEYWKKFTVHSTVLEIIAISFWGSLLGKLLKQCAKEKPWLCTIYTMFLMIIWYHKRDDFCWQNTLYTVKF
jgi:hypothetical protein